MRSAAECPRSSLLHTTPGLGNAVSALATSRVNRAPLVVVVGQQDRRHLAHEPFLAGKLAGLAGEYPVWVDQPVRPQDVPGAIDRAWHEAQTRRGPALVIVPMDDWLAPARTSRRATPRPTASCRGRGRRPGRGRGARRSCSRGASRRRSSPGAGADDPDDVGGARRARRAPRAPGLAGAVRRAGRLPAGPSALRGRPLRRPRQAPRGARRARRRPRRRRPRLPPVRLRRGPVRRGGDDGRGRHRGSGRGAAQPRASSPCSRRPRRVLRRARRAPAAARTPSRPRRGTPPEPPAPDDPLRAGHVLDELAAAAAARTRSSSRRRRRTGPSCSRASRPGSTWA